MSIEINTVDAFQGRETDIVFYSVVRSKGEKDLKEAATIIPEDIEYLPHTEYGYVVE